MAPTLLEPGPDGRRPLDAIVAWLRPRLAELQRDPPATIADRVLCIRAGTGSGKSTALPAALFELLSGRGSVSRYRGRSIICTQPRVLTAVEIARDLDGAAWAPQLQLGTATAPGTIGWLTGGLKQSVAHGLVFATVGVLRAQLDFWDDDAIIDRYAFILVDEAHERSAEADVLLLQLKQFLARNAGRPRLPFVLLLSATFDPAAYARYFGVPATNVFDVPGRTATITMRFAAAPPADYAVAAGETAAALHAAEADPPARGDILVFLPGVAEIETAVAAADRALAAAPGARPALLLKLTGEDVQKQTPAARLAKARLDPSPVQARFVDGAGAVVAAMPLPPPRRIIFSTVVAETGITFENLGHVVDPGFMREGAVFPPWNVRALITRPAAASRILQRRGRVGRVAPGTYHGLYTEEVWAALPPQQHPDLVTSGCEGVFASLLALGAEAAATAGAGPGDWPAHLDLLDPVPAFAFWQAFAKAAALGLVDGRTGVRTPLGELATRAPRVAMEEFRTVAAAPAWQIAVAELATALAAVRVRLRLPAAAVAATLPAWLPPAVYAALPPDDFADAVVVFDGYYAALAAAGAAGDAATGAAKLAAFLAATELELETLEAWRAARAELLAELDGLPWLGAATEILFSRADGFLDRLRRFKRCIYDGFRANALTRRGPPSAADRAGAAAARAALVTPPTPPPPRPPRAEPPPAAYTYRGVPVAAPRATAANAHFVVTAGIVADSRLAVLRANFVCVLDGLVAADPELLEAADAADFADSRKPRTEVSPASEPAPTALAAAFAAPAPAPVSAPVSVSAPADVQAAQKAARAAASRLAAYVSTCGIARAPVLDLGPEKNSPAARVLVAGFVPEGAIEPLAPAL